VQRLREIFVICVCGCFALVLHVCLLLTFVIKEISANFNIVVEVLARAIKQQKRNKRYPNQKERSKFIPVCR
jgi:hypothetical protein